MSTSEDNNVDIQKHIEQCIIFFRKIDLTNFVEASFSSNNKLKKNKLNFLVTQFEKLTREQREKFANLVQQIVYWKRDREEDASKRYYKGKEGTLLFAISFKLYCATFDDSYKGQKDWSILRNFAIALH